MGPRAGFDFLRARSFQSPLPCGERLDAGFQILDGEICAESVVGEDVLEMPGRIAMQFADPSDIESTPRSQEFEGPAPDLGGKVSVIFENQGGFCNSATSSGAVYVYEAG